MAKKKNNQRRFFFVLHFDKTWIFDQSERTEVPISVIKENNVLLSSRKIAEVPCVY